MPESCCWVQLHQYFTSPNQTRLKRRSIHFCFPSGHHLVTKIESLPFGTSVLKHTPLQWAPEWTMSWQRTEGTCWHHPHHYPFLPLVRSWRCSLCRSLCHSLCHPLTKKRTTIHSVWITKKVSNQNKTKLWTYIPMPVHAASSIGLSWGALLSSDCSWGAGWCGRRDRGYLGHRVTFPDPYTFV